MFGLSLGARLKSTSLGMPVSIIGGAFVIYMTAWPRL